MMTRRPLSTLAQISSIVVGVPAAIYTYKVLAMVTFQDKIIYPSFFPIGSRSDIANPSSSGLNSEPISLRTSDGITLNGWFPKNKRKANINLRTLVYFQGNAGNLGHRWSHISLLMDSMPVNILAVHYRGYGNSTGRATERGIQTDVDTIFKYLSSHDDLKHGCLVFGHSLGGAVALYAAEKYPDVIKGVILENSFTSIAGVVESLYPKWTPYPYLTFMLWNHWDSLTRIQRVTAPMLFLSAREDEVIPSEHMTRLYDNSKMCRTKNFVSFSTGLHDTLWLQPGYSDALRDFYSRLQK